MFFVTSLFVLTVLPHCHADVVYLNNGGELRGKVVSDSTPELELEMFGGLIVKLDRGTVESIVFEEPTLPKATSTPTRLYARKPTSTPTPTPTIFLSSRYFRGQEKEPNHEESRQSVRPSASPRKSVPPSTSVGGPSQGVDAATAMGNFDKYKKSPIVWYGTISKIHTIAKSTIIYFAPEGAGGRVCSVHCSGTNYGHLKPGDTIQVKGQIAGTRMIGGTKRKIVYALDPPEKAQ